jgi:hypothetical protein
MKRFRVRAMHRDYKDDGPDLLRPEQNAIHQFAQTMGRAKAGWHVRRNPPGRKDWTDWSKDLKRGGVLNTIDDEFTRNAPNGGKLQVGRRPRKGKPIEAKAEMLVVEVRHVNLSNVNAGAELVADLAREQFNCIIGGFACRPYNFDPGSGWSDHAWGDAVDLTARGVSNDKLTDWCIRMAKENCFGSPGQFIGSKGGRVGAVYSPSYNWTWGGPESHKTHVHCSYRQHYGANPGC